MNDLPSAARRLAILLILAATVGSSTLDLAIADPWPQVTKASGLELNIAIQAPKFCSGSDNDYSEVFEVTTRYTNKRESALTVLIGTDVPVGTLVAQSAEAMKAAKYESEIGGPLLPMDGGRYMLGSDPKSERAVTLAPGEFVETKHLDGILVTRPQSPRIPGTIMSGTHFLQVRMYIKVLDRTAQMKGTGPASRRARFHWMTATSQLVQFEVPENPPFEECQSLTGTAH